MAFAQKGEEKVVDLGGGANQVRARAYNERLVLSLVRRHQSLPKSEIARRSGLSPQTVSVIMRALEKDGLLVRGDPRRGKVGQPSIPMSLDPDGAYAIGLKIGRRSADLILVDFLGHQRLAEHITYPYPLLDDLLEFARNGVEAITATLSKGQRDRVAGIGIAMPFELWNWAEKVGAPDGKMENWRDLDFRAEISSLTGLAAFAQNDATSACSAELVFGRGAEFSDFVYFYIGSFIGGGIVLNHSVYAGRSGNAGALGSMPALSSHNTTSQLIDHASIHRFEQMLQEAGKDASPIWLSPENWSGFGNILQDWINQTAYHLSRAIASACSIIDFEAAIIDGGFPENVRHALVAEIGVQMRKLDLQGIEAPQIVEGKIGSAAGALGAASLPLSERYLPDQNVVFKEMG